MELFFVSVSFAAGFAACWFGKDKITLWYKGTEDFVVALENKARDLKAKI